jgi:ABC-type dipeptide/oligopeptide/nickel transport system permease component
MFSRLITTLTLLTLCAIVAFIQALITFAVQWRRPNTELKSGIFVIPTMVLGPAALVLGFGLFKISLVFPIFMFSNYATILAFSIVPALILCCSSGLALNILNRTALETYAWKSKPCFLVSRAFGKPVFRSFYKIIAGKGFLTGWQQSLPWLFGELVIVESIFNVPGLGSHAWKLARERNFVELSYVIGAIFAVYFLTAKLTYLFHKKLGAKFESYA